MGGGIIKGGIKAKRKFDKNKEGLENTNIVGALRSGRLNIFDEIRAAAQARIQRLEGEMDMVALMSDLHRSLQKIVKKVLDNADETAPDSTTLELDQKYYDVFVEFLEIAKGIGNDIEALPADNNKFNNIKNIIHNDSDLQYKVKKVVKNAELMKVKSSNPNYWIEVLKLSVKRDINNELTVAKKRKAQLEKKDNSKVYNEAIEELRVARKKLRVAQMGIKWIKRDTEETTDRNFDLVENERATRDVGEDDIRKHYKKLGNARKVYAESTTCATDTLIDIYRAVDSENQTKIIGPQSKNVIFKIQEINGKDIVKEAKAEIAELTKSNEKQIKKEQGRGSSGGSTSDPDTSSKAVGGTYKKLGVT